MEFFKRNKRKGQQAWVLEFKVIDKPSNHRRKTQCGELYRHRVSMPAELLMMDRIRENSQQGPSSCSQAMESSPVKL